MFTGIVQQISKVASVQKLAESLRLGVDLGRLAEEVSIGDSVMVDGVCLTATSASNGVVLFDVAAETAGLTTLSDFAVGRPVNIEPAMRPADRFGGHFVSGHVDGAGKVISIVRNPGEVRMRVGAGENLIAWMIPKGSVAVNGISLTIAALGENWFEVSLIPHTMRVTTLHTVRTGDMVNIECDMIGKWVLRALRTPDGREYSEEENGLTMDKLGRMLQ